MLGDGSALVARHPPTREPLMILRRFVPAATALLAVSHAGWGQAPAPGTPAPAPQAPPAAAPKVDQPAAAPSTGAVTPLGHVEVRGTGPVPVVLIPNLVMDWTIFESFMQRNSEKFTMYAVTLPGFAGSAPPPM